MLNIGLGPSTEASEVIEGSNIFSIGTLSKGMPVPQSSAVGESYVGSGDLLPVIPVGVDTRSDTVLLSALDEALDEVNIGADAVGPVDGSSYLKEMNYNAYSESSMLF